MTGHNDHNSVVAPEEIDKWTLRYEGFDPAHEGLREALCTLGNGYFATRGAAPEAVADGVHYPGSYVAGLYDRRLTQLPGHTVENESIVNLPNWLPLSFHIGDGPWFDPGALEILEYQQDLDLRQATLSRMVRVRDGEGRVTRVVERRLVSMADPHVAGLGTVRTSENWSGRLTVRSGLDGGVVNAGGARYRYFDDHHLEDIRVDAIDHETIALSARTTQSEVRIAETARTRIWLAEKAVSPERRTVEKPGYIGHEMAIDVEPQDSVAIEKIVTLFTSKDRSISEPWVEASALSGRIGPFNE